MPAGELVEPMNRRFEEVLARVSELNPYADQTSADGKPWPATDTQRPWDTLSADEQKDFQPAVSAYHIGGFVAQFGLAYRDRDRKPGREAWKVHAARMDDALKEMAKTFDDQAVKSVQNLCAPRVPSGCPAPAPDGRLCLSGVFDPARKVCVSPVGWACDDAAQCQSGKCTRGRCTT